MRERVAAFAWAIAWQTLFRWSPPPFNWWRLLLLRFSGATIHGRPFVSPSVRIEYPWNLELRDGASIAHKVIINCMGRVTVGEHARISQYSHLCAGTHDYTRCDMRIERRNITIGSGAWVAADAFVGPGVTVGEGAILAARSSAFNDVPAGQICAGEPARPLRQRQAT
jgi:putative colanic acid biosynthesis acetyltransferase WcaF